MDTDHTGVQLGLEVLKLLGHNGMPGDRVFFHLLLPEFWQLWRWGTAGDGCSPAGRGRKLEEDRWQSRA